ncbi:MAG TPA: ABC transporter substrate-binding protein [Chloroflexota bacterium]|nr:ABC transporter substrate-binding protein [Chloroflexota bacterium]
MRCRYPLRGTAGVLAVLVVAACASGPAASPAPPAASAPAVASAATAPAQSDALQAMVEAARKEGQLSLVWGEGTMGGNEGVRRLAEGYNKYYGLNVNVQFTPGASMPQMVARVGQEVQAGRPTATDLVVAYASSMLVAAQANALEPVAWASWAPNVQDPQLVTGGGIAVAFQSSLAGITYNTSRLRGDLVPHTLQDLLKPEYKGRLASTSYAAYFDLLSTDELWGAQRTFDYVTRLSDQVAGLIRCNETERLISGEFDALALDCSQSDTYKAKAQGAPLDYVVPTDAPLLLYLYVGVPKTAPHPNAAKLWVNYLLTREAQDVLYATNFQDLHLLPGSKTKNDLADVERANVKPTLITLEFLQRLDEQDFLARRARIQDLLTRGQ